MQHRGRHPLLRVAAGLAGVAAVARIARGAVGADGALPGPAGATAAPRSRGHRWLLLVAVALVAFAATLLQTSEWDTFFHLAYGRDLVRRGHFPGEDPFLYPLAGLPAAPQPGWLGSLAIYGAWLLGGEAGPVLLVAAVAAAIFALLLREALPRELSASGLAAAALPLALALAVFRERASARPELFASLLLVATLAALRRHAAGRSRLLLSFPLLAVAWTNLHPSLPAGLAAVGLFVAVNALLLVARRAWPGLPAEVGALRPLGMAAGVLAAGIVGAAILSPGGAGQLVGALEFARSALGSGASAPGGGSASLALLAASVDELRSPSTQQLLGPFGWLVGLTAVSAALAWRRANLREVVTCAAFLVLALGARRFMALAALVMAPVAARHLGEALRAVPARAAAAARAAMLAAAVLGIAGAAWETAHAQGVTPGVGVASMFPARAVAYLESIGFRGRFFNTFHFGGYLAWTLDGKVFQDGRGLLRPEDARAAYAGPSAYDRFAKLDARYRFDALVVQYPQFTDAAFASLAALPPGADWGADRRVWALVAFDDGGQVYLRRDGAHAAEAARDEYRVAMPTNSLVVPQHGDPAALEAELRRSLREVPGCRRCRSMLGYLLVAEGRPAEAELLLLAASEGLPETRLYALLGLAQAAEARGNRREAERWLRALVATAPDPSWSRRRLATLLLDDRRADEAWREIERNLGSDRARQEDLVVARRIAAARKDETAVRELGARLRGELR